MRLRFLYRLVRIDKFFTLQVIYLKNKTKNFLGIIWNGDFAQPCEFTDFNDISNFVDSLFSCQRICSSSSVCTHYNWIPIASSTQGTCFMKSGTIRKEQAVSSSSNVNNTCGIVNGGIDWSNINYALPCDWSGIVLTVLFQIPNPNTCASRCRQFSGCTRYTYSLGTCWLRGGAVSLSTAINSYNTRDNNMVCGYVSNGIVWNKNLAFGCDWNDTVVATNTTILWYQCESICIHNSSCIYFRLKIICHKIFFYRIKILLLRYSLDLDNAKWRYLSIKKRGNK